MDRSSGIPFEAVNMRPLAKGCQLGFLLPQVLLRGTNQETFGNGR